jgi:hypothetical protein
VGWGGVGWGWWGWWAAAAGNTVLHYAAGEAAVGCGDS